MQLMPILLVAAVMAVSNGMQPMGADWHISIPMQWLLAWGPVLAMLVIATILLRKCDQALARGRVQRPAATIEWVMRVSRALILINHALTVMVFGWLGAVRQFTGNLVLI